MLIANLVPWTVAWVLTGRCLEDFVYGVQPGVAPYVLVALLMALGSLILIAVCDAVFRENKRK